MSSETNTNAKLGVAPDPPPGRRGGRTALAVLAVCAVAGGVILSGIASRVTAEAALKRATSDAAAPSVITVHPASGAPQSELTLPGYTQAFTDTPVYARTSGYLKAWRFDIGAHVRKGDVLAEIETPEVDQQLRQARADLVTAQADLKLAAITAKRDEDLLKTRAVSTQERDNSAGAFAAYTATVQSRAATVARLEQLTSYEKVVAPFDGVITARNTDVGALIAADANAPAKELFHIAASDTLRVYVSVPEAYDQAVKNGDAVGLTLEEFPGRTFNGTLVRNANSIDPASRTLLIEVDVDNRDGVLLPGAYCTVHLTLPGAGGSVTVPSNTLLFRSEGLRVAVVRAGQAQLVPVTIGRDYGERVEIISGLIAGDDVIVDPSDSLVSGTAVRVEHASKG